jgi:hypothetical protein
MPDFIEVKLLNYVFQFKRIMWREEFGLKFVGKDPQKWTLAHALYDVVRERSRFTPKTVDDAYKLLSSLPPPVVKRVYILYIGLQPKHRTFTVTNLYRAPEPSKFAFLARVSEENQQEAIQKTLESQFDSEQLREIRETERAILNAARTQNGFRGAAPVKEPQ